MPKFVHKGYKIDWETGPIDHAKAVAFEKALKERHVQGEVRRELWRRIVDAAAETGIIPPLEKPVAEMNPGLVAWLAGKIAGEHNQATAILPE